MIIIEILSVYRTDSSAPNYVKWVSAITIIIIVMNVELINLLPCSNKFQGNYTKFLKNLHTEQLAKLHLKNQHECDLLEDIRQFTVKRSAIEKSYSEALLKISSAYLNKKMPNIPEIKMDGAEEKW